MATFPVLRAVDAVTVPVPSLDEGLRFYRDGLGHRVLWRNDAIGQVGLQLPGDDTELVLTTGLDYAVNWLVGSVPDAVATMVASGAEVIVETTGIPVGRLAVLRDPFGNPIVLLDLSTGRYDTDNSGRVLGVRPSPT
jgi:catechol 2,3-dioxygenase-like lactoylglutathione lyase family enzyme